MPEEQPGGMTARGAAPRLGFIVALPAEGKTLARQGLDFGGQYRLTSGHWLTVSGTGPENARQAAIRLVEQGVNALLSWGCASALDAGLNPGDLLLPAWIIDVDGTEYAVDSSWHEMLSQALLPLTSVATGPLIASEQIIATSQDKRAWHESTGAIAVDMESGGIAAVAQAQGLPYLTIRSIADTASMRVPSSVLRAVDAQGHVNLPKLLLHACRHPLEFSELAQLGWA